MPVVGGLTVKAAVRDIPAAVAVRVAERADVTLVVDTVNVTLD